MAPVMYFDVSNHTTFDTTYTSTVRELRMTWKGHINILLTKPQFMMNYVGGLFYRWKTGSTRTIGEERRQDMIFRNIYHFFIFGRIGIDPEFEAFKKAMSGEFREESINAIAIKPEENNDLNIHEGHFDILWTKARPDGMCNLIKVNEWYRSEFMHPTKLFPPISEVYRDMKGRLFHHPVMHKSPWNYVTYGTDNQI